MSVLARGLIKFRRLPESLGLSKTTGATTQIRDPGVFLDHHLHGQKLSLRPLPLSKGAGFNVKNDCCCDLLAGRGLALSVNAQDLENEMFNFNVGGGLSVPLNPTGRYFGVSGNAGTGMGANFNKHNSIEGDFM